MNYTRFFFLFLFAGTLLLTGCDSSADGDDGEMTMANLRLEPVVAGSPLSSHEGHVYTINGRAMTLESARLYISEVTLIKEDGSTVAIEAESPLTVPARDADENDVTHTVTDKIMLFKHDQGEDTHHLGEIEAGDYRGIRFKVGIDGLNNGVDASQVAAGHPLAKQTDRNNHWSWKAGYIYLRMDGLVDGDGDGTPESDWAVHLGTTNFLTTVELDFDFHLHADEMSDLHIMVDYAQFIADVDYGNSDNHLCHTMNNIPVAQKVGASISDAFMFHGVHAADDGHGHDHN